MGFKIFDFKMAAPGVVIVQVFWGEIPPEREHWLIAKLDAYYRACRDNDLFHLSFIGYLDGLQAAGVISGYKERIAAPRAAFDGYRCAYRGHAPPTMQEPPAAGKVMALKSPLPDPSPLAALLQPDALDRIPSRPLNSPEDERVMQDRLNNIWDNVPDGMVAE